MHVLRACSANYRGTNIVSPADTAGIGRNPLLVWNKSVAAASYNVQVATDSMFSYIVADTTVADTAVRLSPLAANTKFYWHFLAMNSTDTGTYSDTATFSTGSEITAVKGSQVLPTGFELSQNYPNPFNPTTNIGYRVANVGFVSLKVYDVLGREVRTLVSEVRNAGSYEVQFDASDLPSGVYMYRLSVTPVERQGMFFMEAKKVFVVQ